MPSSHTQVKSSPHSFRLRFSLRTLLVLIVYAALVCGWMYWLPVSTRDVVGSGVFGGVSVGIIIASLITRQSAADLLIVGCLVVLLNVVCGYIEAPSIISTYPPTPHQFARILVENVCANTVGRTTLPLLVLVPVAYGILHRRNLTTTATKWFLIAIAIAVVDVAICGIGLATAFTWFAAM